jgi:hypothetical protein
MKLVVLVFQQCPIFGLPKSFDPRGRRADAIFKAIVKLAKPVVQDIWEIYTQRSDELSRKLITNKQSVVAYLLGFHLANMARASELYQRSDARHRSKKKLKQKKYVSTTLAAEPQRCPWR